MENTRVLSIIIIVVLVAAFISAVYVTGFGYPQNNRNNNKVNMISNEFKLTNAQVQDIELVNINIDTNSSGLEVSFQNDSDSIYNITTQQVNDSREPSVTYSKNGNTLDVNVFMDSGSAKLVLNNKYTYNGTYNTKVGGMTMVLANDSKIDQFTTNIQYIGGGSYILKDTRFNNLNMNVNLGGFMIQADNPNIKKNGNISTNVQIGGITISINPLDKLGLKINGKVDLGGFSFDPEGFEVLTNTSNNLDIQSKNFNNQTIKLQINNTIGLGGLNINTFVMPINPNFQ